MESCLLNSVFLLCLSDPRRKGAVFSERSPEKHVTFLSLLPLARFKGISAVAASRHQLSPANSKRPFSPHKSSRPLGLGEQIPGFPAGALSFCWEATPQTGKLRFYIAMLSGYPYFKFKEGFIEKPLEKCNCPTEITKRLMDFDLKAIQGSPKNVCDAYHLLWQRA